MLKVRIIGVIIIKSGIVVQSVNFRRYLPVGRPEIAIEYLDRWGIDEIVLLNIEATPEMSPPDVVSISRYSKYCHVPLAVGGGIKNADDIKRIIHAGADKVIINTQAVVNPAVITEGATLFGSQSIVVSIDAVKMDNGTYTVYTNCGKQKTEYTPSRLAKLAQDYGAGEVLINSIDRDGSKKGYDIDLIQQVMDAVDIPVIACGGVNHPKHFLEAMNLGVSAVAAANFFHYTEHSVVVAKQYLKTAGANIRLDSYCSYDSGLFDEFGRVAKVTDSVLEKLRFEYIPEEII